MPESIPDLLVVAATTRELAPAAGWRTLLCGVGPVDAACATAAAIVAQRPAALLHVGIAGARRAAALAPGTLVIGASAHYDDLGVPERFAPRTLTPDASLLAAARAAFPEALVSAIATSARVDGTASAPVEAMEGFAVLRAAALAGVPALEVRAIANDIEEPDRARWHFDEAFAAITAATPRLVEAVRGALARGALARP
jgi:nucleoside phosphorylase